MEIALGGGEELGEVRPGHDAHAQERGLVELVAHLGADFGPDASGVERLGPHRAVPGPGAGRAAVDVLDFGARNELQGGLVVEEADHVRDRLEERVHLVVVVVPAQAVAQVGAEEFAVLVDAVGLGQRVSRGPGPAAGPGRGTAADVCLFHHNDF